MGHKEKLGRAMILVIFSILFILGFALPMLLLSAPPFTIGGVTIGPSLSTGIEKILVSLAMLALIILWMYGIWIGHDGARWLFVILSYLQILIGIPGIIFFPHPILIGLSLLMAAITSMIAFSKSISAFLIFQRSTRNSYNAEQAASLNGRGGHH